MRVGDDSIRLDPPGCTCMAHLLREAAHDALSPLDYKTLSILLWIIVGLNLNLSLFICLTYLSPDCSFLEGWVQYTIPI